MLPGSIVACNTQIYDADIAVAVGDSDRETLYLYAFAEKCRTSLISVSDYRSSRTIAFGYDHDITPPDEQAHVGNHTHQ